MRRKEWLALVAAYVILVAVVIWTTWSADNVIDQMKADDCALARIALETDILVLEQFNLIVSSSGKTSIETLLGEYSAALSDLAERCD